LINHKLSDDSVNVNLVRVSGSADPRDSSLATLAVLSEEMRWRLYALVRAAHRPVSREEAAASTGISRKLAAFHLDKLVSAGLLRARYEALCARLGIADRVTFFGYRGDVHELLARSDIAVLTSIKEGIPRAVLEAMAAGVPVVATRVPGTSEAVWHGETGLLVPLDDAQALAGALAHLIANPEVRSAMGARARAVAVRNHDERSVIGTLCWIYRARLLAPGGITRNSFPEVWHERARHHSRARR